MSRRCRNSLVSGGGGSSGDGGLSSGCDCGRLGPDKVPCTEPLLYGTNILLDSGFEFSLPEVGGLAGEDFPQYNSFEALYWDPGGTPVYASVVPGSGVFWGVRNNNGVGYLPVISSDDPHQGTFHVTVEDADVGTGFISNVLVPIGIRLCDVVDGNGNRRAVTGRCNPGDLIVGSIYMKRDTNGGTIDAELQIAFYEADMNSSFVSPTGGGSVGITYSQFTVACFVPTTDLAVYFSVEYGFNRTVDGSVAEPLFIDTGQVMVIPAGSGVLLCSQASLTTIDNSTTETNFL